MPIVRFGTMTYSGAVFIASEFFFGITVSEPNARWDYKVYVMSQQILVGSFNLRKRLQ